MFFIIHDSLFNTGECFIIKNHDNVSTLKRRLFWELFNGVQETFSLGNLLIVIRLISFIFDYLNCARNF
jgi:hypothetical protein